MTEKPHQQEKNDKKRVSADLTETLDYAGGADRARTGDIRRDRPQFHKYHHIPHYNILLLY